MSLQLILGTMTWGYSSQTDKAAAIEQIKHVAKYNESQPIVLDTARIYQWGQTEELIGEILPTLQDDIRSRIHIHTKAHPFVGPLTADGLREQLTKSLKALDVPSVEVFYLHAPDIKSSFEETLETCDILYKEGKFKELGLSNYASWDVMRAYYLCKENGWVLPTVYQGCYNLLSRSPEPELLPALRTLNIRFNAYNPLAGGFLTGKYSAESLEKELTEGRFSSKFDLVPKEVDSPFKGIGHKVYKARYLNETLLKALDVLKSKITSERSLVSLSLNWVEHHSWLKPKFGDGIIIGASKSSQCEQNVKFLQEDGPLEEQIIAGANEAWEVSSIVSEPYFRGYGPKPGNSEDFLAKY